MESCLMIFFTFILAIATVVLAIATVGLARHTKRLVESSNGTTRTFDHMRRIVGTSAIHWRQTPEEMRKLIADIDKDYPDNKPK